MSVLIVDAANVVGSVPDGWWRDRAGAAARLHAALVAHPGSYERVVLVLEGKARAGAPEGTECSVTTVHAGGEGDDEIVAQAERLREAGDDVAVATADRGLIERLGDVMIVGPRSVRGGVSGH